MAYTERTETATATRHTIKYSKMETALLQLLAKGKEVSSDELVARYYEGDAPFAARHSVTSVMRTLIRKVDLNREPFMITKSKLNGPYPSQYKKVPRQSRKK